MNRLVIIGNGFDLAHGLKTSYKDFIRWYLENILLNYFYSERKRYYYSDVLFTIKLKPGCEFNDDMLTAANYEYFNNNENEQEPWLFLKKLSSIIPQIDTKKSILFKKILENIETKGWTDIESDYYELLKKNADDNKTCKELNEQMDFLKNKLAKYLETQKTDVKINIDIFKNVEGNEISQNSRKVINKTMDSKPLQYRESDFLEIEDIMILDFNYTSTTKEYFYSQNINHIHGSLENPQYMIFGYGDEMDKDFQTIEDKNNNELLENCKSVKYLETSHYKDLLEFIEGGFFQVYIMGHSCGNSDRTLLNTIFEHENCASIKPFYHKWGEGENDDNYSDITRNIYRNFKNKTLFRDRVVNKEICEPLPQVRKVNN